MKKRNILLFFVLFIITGEILVRFDKTYDLLDNAPKIIETKIEKSKLITSVASGDFVANESQLRIMVVGDSYIYGGGIDPQKKFSKRLLQKFNSNNTPSDNTLVLDVSRPSNNTQENFDFLMDYEAVFKPNIVIWAYNFNDILRVEPRTQNEVVTKRVESKPKEIQQPKREKNTSFRKVIRGAYEFSELLQFSSTKIQKEMKVNGFVLPFGEFHYLTKKGYLDSDPSWTESQKILADAVKKCEDDNIELILYKVPEFNLLENNSLFSEVDKSLEAFINKHPSIHYIDGFEDFENVNVEDFILSTYDGHPNENAHQKIADKIYSKIKSLE